jgi:DNA-binding NarL/FixJ family response regulator
MTAPISILLADDHSMVRRLLGRRLEDEADMTVVATVSNADDATAEAIRLKPDIILMDIDMPGLSCFEAAGTIHRQSPGSRIIFLSAFFHDRYIEQAMAVQAWGYITKSEPEDSVLEAIRKVSAGIAYFSPEVKARIVVDSQGARLASKGRSRASTLTEREMEVLRYLARGMAKKEIARTMHISVNTVNRHTTSLMAKLDIHDRVELARYAIREGLAEA